MAKKTKQDKEHELRLIRGASLTWSITSVLNQAIRWGALVAIVWLSGNALVGISENVSGKITEIVVSIIGAFKLQMLLPLAIGGGGLVYGFHERKLRYVATKRQTTQIKALERVLDPNRSTSWLSPKGEREATCPRCQGTGLNADPELKA